MKCIVCKSLDIQLKHVEEEIRFEKDIILVPIDVHVCNNCGERYYNRQTMKKLEETRVRLENNDLSVENVGRVLRANVA